MIHCYKVWSESLIIQNNISLRVIIWYNFFWKTPIQSSYFGHQNNYDEAFDNVQNSNLSKACKNLEEVQDTIEMYITKKGMNKDNISFKKKNDFFIVFRVEDGKILKNKYYKPTELKQFV